MIDDAPKPIDYRKGELQPLPTWARVLYAAVVLCIAVPVLVGVLVVLMLFLSRRL